MEVVLGVFKLCTKGHDNPFGAINCDYLASSYNFSYWYNYHNWAIIQGMCYFWKIKWVKDKTWMKECNSQRGVEGKAFFKKNTKDGCECWC
jgi:hypothetical protein